MKNEAAARRYALALMESVPEADQDAVGEVLMTAARVLTGGPAWQILKNPIIGVEQKREVVGQIIDPDHPVYRLLAVTLEHRREALISDIAAQYQDEIMRRQGRVRAVVRTAQALSEAWAARLQETLSQSIGRELVPTFEVDPGLIGGVEVRLPDRVLDGTIRGRLARLQAQLKREVETGEA
jgi:F-type H+-transporting ATPase subunit delta